MWQFYLCTIHACILNIFFFHFAGVNWSFELQLKSTHFLQFFILLGNQFLLNHISLVMEAILSPQCVARKFVRQFLRQYYTILHLAPFHLHRYRHINAGTLFRSDMLNNLLTRFYYIDSSFERDGLKGHGPQEIHQKIIELNFRNCETIIASARIGHTLHKDILLQVTIIVVFSSI